MTPKLRMMAYICLVLSSLAASADNYYPTFSGSGTSGFVTIGSCTTPFAYDADGGVLEGNWGLPGVGAGWTNCWPAGFTGLEISFDLPPGTIIDPAQISVGLNANCVGGTFGGTTLCSTVTNYRGSRRAPWDVYLLTPSSIGFVIPYCCNPADPFFVDIFFSGPDPNGVSFSGKFTPEPNGLALLSTGLLGGFGLLSWKRRVPRAKYVASVR